MKCNELPSTKVVRRSLDARKKLDHPTFNYVVDVTLTKIEAHNLGWKHQPGRTEKLHSDDATKKPSDESNSPTENSEQKKKRVVVVGTGPCGLFCALQLAMQGGITPILMDRGQPVERRGRDIGALMHRRSLDSESNFAFGEGG